MVSHLFIRHKTLLNTAAGSPNAKPQLGNFMETIEPPNAMDTIISQKFSLQKDIPDQEKR